MPLIATRGAASVQGFGEFAQTAAPVYIEDVFSTYLYTGNGSTQTITNGIDLSGKGGLLWIKERANASNHLLFDSQRTLSTRLASNLTNAELAVTNGITSFNNNGFSVGASGATNAIDIYVSWTFREQPKFFDVVTWTSQSGANTVSHNLGSAPGFIVMKATSATDNWWVYHRSLGNDYYMTLNQTSGQQNSPGIWSTSTTSFTYANGVVATGTQMVAYLFAHNAGGFGLTGSDNVISCGSWSGNTTVNLGYEPQWILFRNSGAADNWTIVDNMRGWPEGAFSQQAQLYANSSSAESGGSGVYPTATGFSTNIGAGNFIYIAIRRGPMKTPTTGTSVFYPQAISQADSIDSTNVPFPPDLINTFSRDGSNRTNKFSYFQFVDRLRGAGVPNDTRVAASEGLGLVSSGTDAEYGQANPPGFTYVQLKANSQDITRGTGWNSPSYGNWINYFFRRAPGFFDVVCYTGTGSARTVTHNLGVAPEFMMVKERNGTNSWFGYAASEGPTKGRGWNSSNSFLVASTLWNDTAPTSSVFTVGTSAATNGSGQNFVAYLFATVAGVSKVGSYTGTGTTLQVNCGFTNGSRFVLIKRTDSTGDWYVWDSARGIVAGNDPYLLLNSTAAEVTNTDYVDTYSAGFEISSTAPAAINANGGTFIFLAIA